MAGTFASPGLAGPAATTPAGKGPAGTGPVESEADAAVLARVAAGDPRALAELYDRFGRRVYSLARRICGDNNAAEDAAQEVFLTLWRRADRFDPERGSAASWLLTLAHHVAVDAVRREATVRRHTQRSSDDGWEYPADPGADDGAVGSVVAGYVRDALAELPRPQRRTLALAYYGGYTQPEIAAVLGVPLGTVKSRTFAAMAHLRARLRPLEP